MPYAQTGDCALYYELRGDEGTALLLIAGYGASLIGWYKPLVDSLATRHRVILFDNRGVGHSGKPREPYTMAQFADDAAALLDAVGIDSAHVLSASMGGMIAQHFALRHPNRVRGLVLCCTVPSGPQNPAAIAPADDVLATLTAPRTDDRAQDFRNMWPILYSQRFIEQNGDLLEEMLEQKLAYPEPPQYALECQMHAIIATHDVVDRLGEIAQPTLVMTGTADILVPPENSRLIAEKLPNTRLIEYPGAGHGFLEEVGMQAADDILAFLAEADGES
jgi:pimeloyl-ACP methyl ester carboxylesterase